MKQSHDVEAELIAGSGGIFEVRVDGAVVYAKSDTGRFPKPGEVGPLLPR